MKTLLTPHLIIFALIATLLAVLFRYFLSYGIEHQSTATVILSAVSYALGMFASGWHLGSKDSAYLPILDVGFRFHLTTYLTHNGVSLLWFALGLNSGYESVTVVHMTAGIWSVILILHFVCFLWARKHSIKGLDKHNLFE
jgi:hypothetical protein